MVVRYLFIMLFLPGTENGIPRKASSIISEQYFDCLLIQDLLVHIK